MSRKSLVISLLAALLAPVAAWGAEAATREKSPGKYADVNGLKMYYEVHGKASLGAGQPLVLLHGGGSTIETTFGRVLPTLAKSRQVIAIEQQGHGRTADIADRPFSFAQSADDTVALLAQLKIEQADFFGFSNGGNIALEIAIRHPSRVRKLVVASAMTRRDGLYPEVWEFMKRSTPENMPPALQTAYRQLSPHPERLASFHDKCAKRMLEFKDMPAEDIQTIAAPTLLIIGDADSVRPEHAVEMFRLLPRAQLAVFPGGHGAYIGEVSGARREDSQVRLGAADNGAKRESKVPDLAVALIEEFLDAPQPASDHQKSQN